MRDNKVFTAPPFVKQQKGKASKKRSQADAYITKAMK